MTVDRGDAGFAHRDLTALRWGFPAAAVAIALVAVVLDPAALWLVGLLGVAVVAIGAWGIWPNRHDLVLGGVIGPSLVIGAHGRMEAGLFLVVLAALIVSGSPAVSGARSVAALTVLLCTPPAISLLQPPGTRWGGWIWVIAVLFTWTMGRAFRRQVALAAALEAARGELADQAVLEERRRIARDVHDLVGHGLSAVLLQVTGARHVLRRDPEAADEALRIAEDAGRRSLADLRRTIGSLRAEGESGRDEPPPELARLDELVAAARAGGLEVQAWVDLDGPVDGTVGVALHRIAQEALVNARRHAPRARTQVRAWRDGAGVRLVVDSDGPLDQVRQQGGFGLAGMRERAVGLGGTFAAGPAPSGWRVSCWIPVDPVGVEGPSR